MSEISRVTRRFELFSGVPTNAIREDNIRSLDELARHPEFIRSSARQSKRIHVCNYHYNAEKKQYEFRPLKEKPQPNYTQKD
jgi:hypothetical protein